ncbi:hypothetical protein DICPUDRAFT_157562 [Dictyostelium purpureum]|uniref:Pesticidal crystal protein domain-containing protein n=1 Tax=Dictyostelium purpureum TaxID=5786 RepID=F0ZZF8_DICPU|nr:uncharacterized protein DICPUDRAFT_157562 [Dictyostelium purpureum]EGC30679.1 hypothetical protein DICPUDRAFT_157562 [Dictyostelium purpureum]|eukprot:XP_003292804.1 hypothetical protein DICPUDRAFT_157562 [Dictyostelium purpureum]
MKLLLTISIFLIILLFCNENSNGSQILSNADYSKNILYQLELRNQKVNDARKVLSKEAVPGKNNFLAGSIATLSVLGPVLILTGALPFGFLLELAAGVLEFAELITEGKANDEYGREVSKGIQELVQESIKKYDIVSLKSSLQGLKNIVVKFDMLKNVEDLKKEEIHTAAVNVDFEFSYALPSFLKDNEMGLSSIGIFVLAANSHLVFLSSLVTNSKRYQFTDKEIQYYYKNFLDAREEYYNRIKEIDDYGKAQLEKKIMDKKITNVDEWNLRNDYYNFMKIYVYDISKYWAYMDPFIFGQGVSIENADVILSKIIGSAFNGDRQLSYKQVNQIIENKGIRMYNGKFTGFSYRNNGCNNSPSGFAYSIPKYFGGINYFISKGKEIETGAEGNTDFDSQTNINGPLTKVKVDQISKITTYSANGLRNSKFYQFGLDINGTKFGDTTWYKYVEVIGYPYRIVSSITPTTFNPCRVPCKNYNTNDKISLIEGMVLGFVNSDIVEDNIIIQGVSSFVDCQKFISINSNTATLVQNGYKNSIKFTKNTRVTYKITLNSFDKKAAQFQLLLEYRQLTDFPFNINVYVSNVPNPLSSDKVPVSLKSVVDECGFGDRISQFATVLLNSSPNNYVTIENIGSDFLLNNLIFKTILED